MGGGVVKEGGGRRRLRVRWGEGGQGEVGIEDEEEE